MIKSITKRHFFLTKVKNRAIKTPVRGVCFFSVNCLVKQKYLYFCRRRNGRAV